MARGAPGLTPPLRAELGQCLRCPPPAHQPVSSIGIWAGASGSPRADTVPRPAPAGPHGDSSGVRRQSRDSNDLTADTDHVECAGKKTNQRGNKRRRRPWPRSPCVGAWRSVSPGVRVPCPGWSARWVGGTPAPTFPCPLPSSLAFAAVSFLVCVLGSRLRRADPMVAQLCHGVSSHVCGWFSRARQWWARKYSGMRSKTGS